jgi:hypothetical protein
VGQSGVHGADVCGCASGVKQNRAIAFNSGFAKMRRQGAFPDQIERHRHRHARRVT